MCVAGLSNKLDTIVGNRSVRFSDRPQRVLIERAFYYNPEILILDEDMLALNNEAETLLVEAINSLQGNKTLLIVVHRLSMIRNCAVIYEIEDGQGVEREEV